MVFSKFIIEGSSLIMAKCTYHKQLATNKDDVKGGGGLDLMQIKRNLF